MRQNIKTQFGSLVASAALLALPAAMIGCDSEPDDAGDVLEEVGESIDEAADEVDDAVDDVSDEVDDAIDD